jgi:hypothetical protein
MRELHAEPTCVLHIRIPEAHHELLKKMCTEKDITMTQGAAQIIGQWIEKVPKKSRGKK